jgi:hypothetical protein
MCTTTPKTNNTYIGLEIQRVALVDLRRCFEAIVKVWFIKTGGQSKNYLLISKKSVVTVGIFP